MEIKVFAENFKELMFEKGNITAKQLARELGLSAPTVTRYRNAERLPDINNLILIADYFHCSTDFLFGREPENPNLTFKKCPPFTEQIVFLANHFRPTFRDFYTDAGIPESTFYEWKNGSSVPTMESINRIAEYYDCRYDYVFGREN